jgi:hypothetical protein
LEEEEGRGEKEKLAHGARVRRAGGGVWTG